MHTIVQQDSYFTTKHDWLCHLATFLYYYICKRWPSDKANHACMAILLNYILCACLLSKRIYNKQLHCTQTSWHIRAFSRGFVHNAVSSWPCNFLHPRCFCLAYINIYKYMRISTVGPLPPAPSRLYASC